MISRPWNIIVAYLCLHINVCQHWLEIKYWDTASIYLWLTSTNCTIVTIGWIFLLHTLQKFLELQYKSIVVICSRNKRSKLKDVSGTCVQCIILQAFRSKILKVVNCVNCVSSYHGNIFNYPSDLSSAWSTF